MTYTVQRGHRYKATIEVPWPKSIAASSTVVLGRLVDAGFDRVLVRALGGGKYEAEAVWLHPDATSEVDYVTHVEDLGVAP